MSDGADSGAGGRGPFDAIDAQLNVFALANGTDLSKGDGYRRLEWFTEGFERAILIEAEENGAFRMSVLSWKTGAAEERTASALGDGLSDEDVRTALAGAIDAANAL